MNGVYLRKYGVQTTLNFELFEVDGVDFRTDAVHAAGDTKIMKDEGAEANTSNGFTDEGQGYSIVLTATEMQAARIVVYVVDQSATKVWLDRTLVIETYGHASAQHPFVMATSPGNTLDYDASGEVTVATNNDKTGYDLNADQSSVTVGTVTTLTTKTGFSLSNSGIDAIFTRASSNYDSVMRSLGGAVSKLVNRLKANSSTSKLEIYKADDSTKLGEQSITSDASAERITELDTD